MTNEYETPTPQEPESPDSGGEHHPRRTAEAFMEYCVQHAPTEEFAETYWELYRVAGDAFAAYLTLEDINSASETLAADFDNVYLGVFASEAAVVDNELTTLGWTDAIDQVIRRQGIPEGVVTWDHRAMFTRLQDVYDIVSLGGYFYVFNK